MRKIALTIITAIVLAFLSCDLPTAIEIKGSPHLGIPVNSDSANLSDILTDSIRDSMKGENTDVQILDYRGFLHNGKEIQTLLIQYPVLKDLETDFQDNLNTVDDFNFNLDDLDLDFDIGDLGEFMNFSVNPMKVDMDLQSLFREIQNKINEGFGAENILSVTLPVGGGTTITFPPWGGNGAISSTIIVDAVEFEDGDLYADIAIGDPSSSNALLGATIILSDIALLDSTGSPIPSVPPTVTLTNASPMTSLRFPLAGKELGGSFQISIGSYTDLSSVSGYVTLTIMPEHVEGLVFRSITGLKLDEHEIPIDEQNIPMDLANNDYFVYAKIGAGTISFDVDNDPADLSPSVFSGFEIGYNINLSQNTFPKYGDSYAGINATISGDGHLMPLTGWEINPTAIIIGSGSHFSLSSASGSFQISDADLAKGTAALLVMPTFAIDRFDEVHIDIGDQLADLQPVIDPIPLDEAAKYLNYIEFKEVGAVFEFGKVSLPGLQIMVRETNLGINTAGEFKDVLSDQDIAFTNYTPSPLQRIYLKNGSPIISALQFEAEIRLKDDKKVAVLENIYPDNLDFKIELKSITPVNDWERMSIDVNELGVFEGVFPEDSEPALDLPDLDEYLQGFEFEGIETKLYISGPSAFFSLRPNVSVNMEYLNEAGSPVSQNLVAITSSDIIENAGMLNLDPNNTGIYSGAMPQKGIDIDLTSILNDPPSSLRFRYNVNLDEVIVTPDMIENKEDYNDPIGVEILIKIPLLLKAGSSGASIAFPDMFEDNDDLFDREVADDESVLDFIKRLALKIELSDSVFSGGELYLTNTENGVDHSIIFPLSDRTLTVDIKGDDLKYINDTVPYKPEIGIRFEPGASMQIPRNLSLVRIEFDAEISFKISLDDM